MVPERAQYYMRVIGVYGQFSKVQSGKMAWPSGDLNL